MGLGLIKRGEVLRPSVPDFNEGLEASVRGLSPEMRDILKAHFGEQASVDGEAVKWNNEVTEYEEQRSEQKRTARDLYPKFRGAFGALRSLEWGTAVGGEMQAAFEGARGVEVAAVACGRKPVFHEGVGSPETAAEIAGEIGRGLPPGVHARAEGCEVYVWNSKLIKPFLEAGASEWEQVVAHGDDGRWLGYGVNWTPGGGPPTKLVLIYRGGEREPEAGFRAPVGKGRLFARARAEDWTMATGEPYDYRMEE